MTKLTTEITIEELQYRIHAHENDLTQMWTADYFLNVQKELLAFKQSAKNSADLKTLVISEIVDFYAGFESPGEPETVDEAQIKLIERIEKVFGLTAPVLPKQPDGTLTDEGTIPAQPAIPEQALNTAKLINKFYKRYPLKTFANDCERAEALGYFMAGAELQCFGDFVIYDEQEQK